MTVLSTADSQITDAAADAGVETQGEAPAIALGTLYQAITFFVDAHVCHDAVIPAKAGIHFDFPAKSDNGFPLSWE